MHYADHTTRPRSDTAPVIHSDPLTRVEMIESPNFLKSILDSVCEHIVVLDGRGSIIFVNQAWVTFGVQNSCKTGPDEWKTVNYLDVCDSSGMRGERFGRNAATGIRKVISQELDHFDLEYPCHSSREKRWFVMSVTRLEMSGTAYFAISHLNITARKLAEDRVMDLSRTDGLTGIPNRRHFDEFLRDEAKRCRRLQLPLSLAIMDIDHFKLLNDHYGHPAGDACLVKIGEILNSMEKRPGDLFARYGGEEFAFVFGNTTVEQAQVPIDKIIDRIRDLKIPNQNSSTHPFVTVSVGVATMHDEIDNESALIKEADVNLYTAKHNGRDRVVSNSSVLVT